MTKSKYGMMCRAWPLFPVLVLSAVLIIGSNVTRAQSDADKERTAISLTVAEDVTIDEDLDNFDDPVLVRAKARVAPVWRGPLGQPPWTERRNCPQVELVGLDTPPFC